MIANGDLERNSKEVVGIYAQVPLQLLLGKTEKNHEKLHSG
jgi:hypothetical protein